MNLKKIVASLGLTAALGMGGAALSAGTAHAAASDAVLLSDVDHTLAVHTVGATCSKSLALSANPLARTKWSTVILCHPYITRKGKVAYHYTYIRVDFTSSPSDVYTSDGWVIPGAWVSNLANMAHA